MTTESHHLIAAALTRAISIAATARGQNESPVADSPMDGVYLVHLAAEVNRLREMQGELIELRAAVQAALAADCDAFWATTEENAARNEAFNTLAALGNAKP